MALTFRRAALIRALRDAWPLWLALAGIGVAFALSAVVSGDLANRFRYTGVGLELFGVGSVAFGLSELRRAFGRPSIWEKAIAWVRQLASVFRPSKPVYATMTAAGSATMSGTARLEILPGPNSTVERRVEILEEKYKKLRTELDEAQQNARREIASLREQLHKEQRLQDSEIRSLTGKLEDLAVGGLHLEFVGVAWILAGGAMSGVPELFVAIWKMAV